MLPSDLLAAFFGSRGAPGSRSGQHGRRAVLAQLKPLAYSLEAWRAEHLQPLPLDADCYVLRLGDPEVEHEDEQCLLLDLPLLLRLAVTARGRPDLQLDLLSLQLGCGGPHGRRSSKGSSTAAPGALQAANRGAALVVARVLFADTLRPVSRALVGAWCVATAARAIQWAAPRLGLWQPEAPRAQLLRRARQGLCTLGALARQYGEPAAALALAAFLWARLHPSSYQIGRCIAALVPVMCGYSSTARECAAAARRGDGEMDIERAWHRRHKWAAQQLAPLMSSLPDRPPLQSLLDLWDSLDIRMGVAVPGGPAGGWGLDSGGSGGGSSSGSWAAAQGHSALNALLALSVTAAVRSRPRRQQQHSQHGSNVTLPPSHVDQEASGRRDTQQQQQRGRPTAPAAPAVPAASAAPARSSTNRGGAAEAGRQQAQRALQRGQQQSSTRSLASLASERCRFTEEQMARLRAYQESSKGLMDSPMDRGSGSSQPAAAGAGVGTNAGPNAGASGVAGNSKQQHHQQERQQQQQEQQDGEIDAGRGWAKGRSAVAAWLGLAPRSGGSGQDAGSEWAPRSPSGSSLSSYTIVTSSTESSAPLYLPLSSRGSSDGRGGSSSRADDGGVAVPSPVQHPWEDWEDLTDSAGDSTGRAVHAGPPLRALYGRADHSLAAHSSLTLLERCQLAARAVQLLCIFAPFLLLGSAMLLLAACLGRSSGQGGQQQQGRQGQQQRRRQEQEQRQGQRQQRSAAAAAGAGAVVQGSRGQERSRAEDAAAGVSDAAAGGPPLPRRLRQQAFQLLLAGCRQSGAAFIKWGQWSATREDIFPEDLCAALSELHDKAPQHSYRQTQQEVLAAFGRPIEELFEWFDPQPLASGSIAQVHRAVMRIGGRPVQVAVKVRHPGVAARIWQDFQLLRPLAALTTHVRSLKGLQLKDSVMQFSHTMTAQADLRVEAAHLRRFWDNFAAVGGAVVIPRPVPGYQTEGVLVESFEPGQSVAHYLRSQHPRNSEVVALGVDAYLQMLLRDNFVHTDLHPGNILVRTSAPPQGSGAGVRERLQIVLLDFGLAEELTPPVRKHFISFLNMIAKGDGRQAAAHLLQWGAAQACPHPAQFVADMEELFRQQCDIQSQAGIDLDGVMKATLHLARKHEVTIDSNYAALVVGICVLVGFATSLDPNVNLMDAATPCLLYYSLTGRVTGRLYM